MAQRLGVQGKPCLVVMKDGDIEQTLDIKDVTEDIILQKVSNL